MWRVVLEAGARFRYGEKRVIRACGKGGGCVSVWAVAYL